MSEANEFVSLGINIGPARLTISAPTVEALVGHLNALAEVDEVEGLSTYNSVVDHVEVLVKGAEVKFAMSQPFNRPATSAPSSSVPSGDAPVCPHGTMKWKTGTTKSGPNVGKNYEGYFCPAPFGATDKCQGKHSSFRYIS